MTLNKKRFVIEALLCAAAPANNVNLYGIIHHDRWGESLFWAALAEVYRFGSAKEMLFGDRLARAAYRLIEESPVLRREWFGVRRPRHRGVAVDSNGHAGRANCVSSATG